MKNKILTVISVIVVIIILFLVRNIYSDYNLKKAVAIKIKEYILNGGFLFAMCSATDSFDIALAAWNVDIAEAIFDGSSVDKNYQSKLDYSHSIAFENYSLYTSPSLGVPQPFFMAIFIF